MAAGCKKHDRNKNENTDIDGNVYHTVIIGTQEWMVENLRTTRYRNGDSIKEITADSLWLNLTTGAWCNYNHDESLAATCGRLYNWFAVNDGRVIAPAGFHIPSEAEWQTLIDFLGGAAVAGGKLKEAGLLHWDSPNTGATNEYGFTALPGGRAGYHGETIFLGQFGHWWTSTSDGALGAHSCYMFSNDPYIRNEYIDKVLGYSVRCIKD